MPVQHASRLQLETPIVLLRCRRSTVPAFLRTSMTRASASALTPKRQCDRVVAERHADHELTDNVLTSNRPVEDWGQLLGDNAATSAMLDRLLHHGHVLKCGPKSYRTHAVG